MVLPFASRTIYNISFILFFVVLKYSVPAFFVKLFSFFVSPKSIRFISVIGHRPAHISVSTLTVLWPDQTDRYAWSRPSKLTNIWHILFTSWNVNVVTLGCDYLEFGSIFGVIVVDCGLMKSVRVAAGKDFQLNIVCFVYVLGHAQNEKAMPSTSRPRGYTGASSSSGGRSAQNTPMSERQQMALLIQMTSSSNQAGKSCGNHAVTMHSNFVNFPVFCRTQNSVRTVILQLDQEIAMSVARQLCMWQL